MRNSRGTTGLSVLEIVVAVLILAFALIPIYRVMTSQSTTEIETTKIAMAKDILKSLRQEIMARPFDELQPHVKNDILEIQPYPLTLEKVLKVQKEYGTTSFDMKVLAKLSGPGNKVIQFEGQVTWKDNRNNEKKEVLTFMSVAQK